MRKVIIFLIIVILIFMFIFLLKGENVFFISLQPLQKFFYGAPKQILTSGDICIENAQLKVYRAENELLKKHLNFLETSYDSFVLANVIGKEYEAGSEWFLIDKGKRHGLVSGLPVVDENGILIGTIVKVKDFTAFIQPIFSPHSSIAADILLEPVSGRDSDLVSGIVQGEYGLTVKMSYVPMDREINISDTVITSGLEQSIRRGIIIGLVSEVNKKPNAIFQEIIIKPLFNSDFRIVSVILP